MNPTFIVPLLLSLVISNSLFAQKQEAFARELYNQARLKSMGQHWQDSIEEYQQIVRHYPDSRYADDAQFWIGYCLEKIPERQVEAFAAYQKLLDDHPGSSWADDALVHQITIAERLVQSGQENYRQFLRDKLTHALPEVRRQAGLALGRLGDAAALPVLQEMSRDADYGELAADLIQSLEVPPTAHLPLSRDAASRSVPGALKAPAAAPPLRGNAASPQNSNSVFFETRRYELYRSMLKTEDNWRKGELLDFGLWHILPTEAFAQYYHLQNQYDKSEWLRKFWKRLDPTPTTERNEAREEFERRVQYAKSNFYQYWDHPETRYLQDQHLRRGAPHAPWDARGELYIKYGEPSFRSMVGWQTENWVYYGLNLDLIVKQYITNIYGNAIRGSTISGRARRDRLEQSRVEMEHIYKPEFIYHFDYQARDLKNVEVWEDSSAGHYEFSYRLPLSEVNSGAGGEIRYLRTYVVFDEDMREVLRNAETMTGEKVLRSGNRVTETIRLSLPAGHYLLAVRLEVPRNKRLAIFKTEFRIR